MSDIDYLPSYEQMMHYRNEMNTRLKQCKHSDEMEKCPQYKEKCSRPGYVDLTCWWWREDFVDDGCCTAPRDENKNG